MVLKDTFCSRCNRATDVVGGYSRDAQGIIVCVECKHAETQSKLSRFTEDLEKEKAQVTPLLLAQRQVAILELILAELRKERPVHLPIKANTKVRN